MKPRHAPPAFPEALDEDDDDVAWALSTGGVEWNRGAHAEALVWLRRAIDSAREGGRPTRVRDLEYRGRTLQVALEVGWVTAKPSAPPIPSASQVQQEDPTETFSTDAYAGIDVDIVPASLPPAAEEITLEEDVLEEVDEIEELVEFDEADIVLLASGPPPRQSSEPERTGLSGYPIPPRSELPEEETTERDLEASALSGVSHAPSEPSAATRPSEEPPASDTLSPSPFSADSEAPESGVVDSLAPPTSESPLLPSDSMLAAEPVASPDSSPPTAASVVPSSSTESVVPPTVESAPFVTDPGENESVPPTSPEPQPNDPSSPAEVGGILLASVAGLQDLPDDAQAHLARRADIHVLSPDEEVGGFGCALVLEGSVAVMPTIADVAAAEVERGEPVFSQGHLADGVMVRVVAGRQGARVAVWDPADFETAIADCPWVGDELKSVGDRFQTLTGVSMGPLGENLDDMLRALVVGRCEVRRLLPGERIAEAGKPVNGMYVLGAGHIEVLEAGSEQPSDSLGPGDFLFAAQILQASPAPADARAGAGGALVLYAERRVAHELMVSVPPLLEIFAR